MEKLKEIEATKKLKEIESTEKLKEIEAMYELEDIEAMKMCKQRIPALKAALMKICDERPSPLKQPSEYAWNSVDDPPPCPIVKYEHHKNLLIKTSNASIDSSFQKIYERLEAAGIKAREAAMRVRLLNEQSKKRKRDLKKEEIRKPKMEA